ncbi:MAG: GntR family transcriptional regulator, partial [Spirochaetaceae bacterium]|nr:GntR family transcriptional regulator [Spirochaetaceae bacterium]MCF7939787.1 GntR family transcriptional regulator [Spirochaetales bacterium]
MEGNLSKLPGKNEGDGNQSSFTDQMIMDEIYRAIIDNRIPPGSRLSQDDLGKVFGVSRTR